MNGFESYELKVFLNALPLIEYAGRNTIDKHTREEWKKLIDLDILHHKFEIFVLVYADSLNFKLKSLRYEKTIALNYSSPLRVQHLHECLEKIEAQIMPVLVSRHTMNVKWNLPQKEAK